MTWQPASGEVLRMRWPIEIATGVAPLVERRRSFRGADRRASSVHAELRRATGKAGSPVSLCVDTGGGPAAPRPGDM